MAEQEAQERFYVGDEMRRFVILLLVLLAVSFVSAKPVKIRKTSAGIDLTPYCIAHWKMNDNAENTIVLDSSGNGYHGTAQQNTSVLHTDSGNPPYLNGALTFNIGIGDYVEIADNDVFSPVLTPFSISLWVYTTATVGELYLIGKCNSEYVQEWLFKTCEWNFDFFLYDYSEPLNPKHIGISTINAHGSIKDKVYGKWSHFVAIYDGGITTSSLKIFLNTEQLDCSSWTWNEFVGIYPNISSVRIGSILGVFGESMILDDVRLFNKALSQAEVNYLYNGGNGRG